MSGIAVATNSLDRAEVEESFLYSIAAVSFYDEKGSLVASVYPLSTEEAIRLAQVFDSLSTQIRAVVRKRLADDAISF